jgi:two-component system response regulator AtoC
MIDVRVIAATSKNLEQEVKNGRFREDLFYRLNVLPIRIPPLIERSEDIPLLCNYFIDRFNAKLGRNITGVAPAAMSLLLQHNWPGNVRELENVIERAMIMAETDVISQDQLPQAIAGSPDPCHTMDAIFKGFSIRNGKEILEKNLIRRALEATGRNRTQAAKLLEISHPSLLSKMKVYNIDL